MHAASPIASLPRLFGGGLPVLRALRLPSGAVLAAVRGSVLSWRGDAIVNAANEGCVGGGGVDGAVNNLGGAGLVSERRALGGCPTGEARVTRAHGLSSSVGALIHAVGPDFDRVTRAAGARLLARAYTSALSAAHALRARSLAFSLLSAGIYRGDLPLDEVVALGVHAVVSATMIQYDAAEAAAVGGDECAGAAASPTNAAIDEIAGRLSTTPDSYGGVMEICFCAFTDAEAASLVLAFDGEAGALSERPAKEAATAAVPVG